MICKNVVIKKITVTITPIIKSEMEVCAKTLLMISEVAKGIESTKIASINEYEKR
jgi:hypothetical protein